MNKDMHEAHDALICIKNKTYINEKNRLKLSNHHYFKDDIEMAELFSDLPEALENNYNFPYRCSFRHFSVIFKIMLITEFFSVFFVNIGFIFNAD